MHSYTLAHIAAATGAHLQGDGSLAVQHFAYDTRRITQPAHSLFMALGGSWRDGHQYVQAAYDLGVRAFWLSQPVALPPDAHVLQSPDVLRGLQQLAAVHRQGYAGPVIALTGSNGKTTVKEWVATLMPPDALWRSPGSWNSQLGVALSLLRLPDAGTLPAVLEAGVSRQGEMAHLQQMLQPVGGLLTHLGDAHDAGFPSREHKLAEKLSLFQHCQWLWVPLAYADHARALGGPQVRTFGHSQQADLYLSDAQAHAHGWTATLHWQGQQQVFQLPVAGDAALHNLLAASALCLSLGASLAQVAARTPLLAPVSMRTELITDHPDITLINDCYSADAESVRNALSLLWQDTSQPRKHLIITDLAETGPSQQAIQTTLLQDALRLFPGQVTVVGPVFQAICATMASPPPCYADTHALLAHLDHAQLSHTTVLLKGARHFALERAIPLLTRKPAQSTLEVHLPTLRYNLEVIRQHLPPGTGVIGMVKAAAYGSGSWEVARLLADAGVAWLAVAYPQEGLLLRQHGVTTPILVLNAQGTEPAVFHQQGLSPCVGTLAELERLCIQVPVSTPLDIHVELDTGMHRMGLLPTEVPTALALLQQHPHIRPHSVFTHLASADEPTQDALTAAQLAAFAQQAAVFRAQYPGIHTHSLNSAGALRFPQHAGDYVRLGIALYGIAPTTPPVLPLQEAVRLSTRILRIADYAAGEGISYGHRYVTPRRSRIATLPLGYADGLLRSLGHTGASVLIHGQRCPLVGTLCMDMCMVDVTAVPQAAIGDEAVIFGKQGEAHLSIVEVADHAGTIPYELLSRMSTRIRRIFQQIE